MRRVGVALGLMGLICAAALPASAQQQVTLFGRNYNVAPPPTPKVLWQPDLTKGNPLIGVGAGGVYREAVSSSGDQTGGTTPGGTSPFLVFTDSTATRFNWLDGGDSTNVGAGDLSGGGDTDANPTAMWMMLTGDPTWADVSITTKLIMWAQNTGATMLLLRAAPKAQRSDPNSYYGLQLTSGNSEGLASMVRDGIKQPNDTSTNDAGGSTGTTLRILKRVNGKWTQLAEVNQDKTSVHIPRVNDTGHDHDVGHGASGSTDALVGGYFQFVAKGTTLTGSVSLDGKTFTPVIQATDTATDALKAGLVGFASYDIEPCFKDILVTTAP